MHPLNRCVTIVQNTSQWDLWEFIIIPSNTWVNSLKALSRECLIGYKIDDRFDPASAAKHPANIPSHSVFLAEAHSEKIKQMPHAFSFTWTWEGPPTTNTWWEITTPFSLRHGPRQARSAGGRSCSDEHQYYVTSLCADWHISGWHSGSFFWKSQNLAASGYFLHFLGFFFPIQSKTSSGQKQPAMWSAGWENGS